MAFQLPELPYAYDALQPYMSAETLQYHHDKHHQAYVDMGNKLLQGSGLEDKSLIDIVKSSHGRNQALFNNAGQHYNHLHFWKWMKQGGGGNKLPGELEKKIASDLGGYGAFREAFIEAGKTQFGSGWAWLTLKDGKLEVTKTSERGEPARSWRDSHSWRRCLGTLLLHRLSQRASEISRGFRRQPHQLGICRGAFRTDSKLGLCPRAGGNNRPAPDAAGFKPSAVSTSACMASSLITTSILRSAVAMSR